MGIDSAIRILVREVTELVTAEVRAQVAGTSHAPSTAPDMLPTGVFGPDRPPASDDDVAAHPPSRRIGDGQLPRAPADPNQPHFDAAEAAWFLRYPTVKAFYHAVRRYAIPHSRKGERTMLFKRADLEKFLAARSRFR